MNLYGDTYEGTWMVYPPNDKHGGFGPFATRDEAYQFGQKIQAGNDHYAVNLTDYPDWHNVGPRQYR